MQPAAQIQMKIPFQLTRIIRSTWMLCFHRNSKPAPHPRTVPAGHYDCFSPRSSMFTVYSPGDKLQIIALRSNSFCSPTGGTTNE
jgi:hypothetical protein